MSQFKLNVESHEEAQQVIRSSAIGFLVIAVLQAVLGLFVAPAVLLDAALYAILGFALLFLKSRVVAIALLLLALLTVITTFLNRFGIMDSGGNNIFLSLLLLYLAVRAVLATFALRRPDASQEISVGSSFDAITPDDPYPPRKP
jgi:hypothetical protein